MMWNNVKLKDICKVFDDGNWIESKDQSDDGIRLIQTGNIKFGTFADRKNKARYISEKTFKRLKCKEIFAGDILVSRLPDPVGRACIIPKLSERAITAVDCTIIRLKEICLPEYLNYFMQSSQYFIDIRKEISGATRQRISRKNLGEILIPLPPPAEQQRIIAKLDTAFAEIYKAIANDKKTLANIKNLNNKIFDKLLNNSKCKNVFLNDICNVERGSSPRPIKSFLTEKKDGVNWIKIGDTKQDGKYISSTKQKITKDGAKQSRIVKKGDFVLTNSMSYGRPYIMSINGCIHDGWFVLRLKDDIDSDYFYYLLSSEGIQNQFKSLAAGSVVKNISGDLVKKTMLQIPSKKIQIEIREKLSIIGEHIRRINKLTLLKIENYQKLRLSIFKNLIGLNTKET